MMMGMGVKGGGRGREFDRLCPCTEAGLHVVSVNKLPLPISHASPHFFCPHSGSDSRGHSELRRTQMHK